jgi:hypothetical protein
MKTIANLADLADLNHVKETTTEALSTPRGRASLSSTRRGSTPGWNGERMAPRWPSSGVALATTA